MADQLNPTIRIGQSQAVIHTQAWRTATNSAAYLLPYLRPDMKVLDIGCGPGSITIGLARLVPQGHAIGLDYVPNPIEKAVALARAQGVHNVSFQLGDIRNLPFPDATFDIVHAHLVLQHIDDPVRGLKEMRRVVKMGGLVACRESDTISWYPEPDGLELWFRLTCEMANARGCQPHPGRFIHVWAETAGFSRSHITKSTGSWCLGSNWELDFLGSQMAEGATSSTFARRVLDEGLATEDELGQIARDWESFRRDGQAWIGVLYGEILCRK